MSVSLGLREPDRLLLENIAVIAVHKSTRGKKNQGHCGWVINHSVKLQPKRRLRIIKRQVKKDDVSDGSSA